MRNKRDSVKDTSHSPPRRREENVLQGKSFFAEIRIRDKEPVKKQSNPAFEGTL